MLPAVLEQYYPATDSNSQLAHPASETAIGFTTHCSVLACVRTAQRISLQGDKYVTSSGRLAYAAHAGRFVRQIDMASEGGNIFVPLAVYFDESGSHAGSHALCVAGYLFRPDHAVVFIERWASRLGKHGLPYFRMSQCAHGNGPFARLCLQERIDLVKDLIALINQFASAGFAVTLSEQEYGGPMREIHPLGKEGGPYSFGVYGCLDGVCEFVERTGYKGEIEYFFESGHRDQSEAKRLMDKVFNNPLSRHLFRYASHAFVDKARCPQVQAADLLAWQWYKDKRNLIEGRPRRKDCEALLSKIFYLTAHVSPKILVDTIARNWRNGTLHRVDPEQPTTTRPLPTVAPFKKQDSKRNRAPSDGEPQG